MHCPLGFTRFSSKVLESSELPFVYTSFCFMVDFELLIIDRFARVPFAHSCIRVSTGGGHGRLRRRRPHRRGRVDGLLESEKESGAGSEGQHQRDGRADPKREKTGVTLLICTNFYVPPHIICLNLPCDQLCFRCVHALQFSPSLSIFKLHVAPSTNVNDYHSFYLILCDNLKLLRAYALLLISCILFIDRPARPWGSSTFWPRSTLI